MGIGLAPVAVEVAEPPIRSGNPLTPAKPTPLPEKPECLPPDGYQYLGELGRGSMGVVFKARHLGLNRVVALKRIVRGPAASSAEMLRFLREAEAAARLNHPHVIHIHEAGQDAHGPFFSMRYMEGGSLAARLEREQTPQHDAAVLIAKVARGVHHAHERGVLHRDLKPANILLDTSGEPAVGDFGVASLSSPRVEITMTGGMMGSPAYMAPEQFAGEPATTAGDTYSLGVILYELLSGRTPYNAPSALSLIEQVRTQEAPALHTVQPGIDRDLETICARCLEKDPTHRYATAAALADDLDAWSRGEPIAARPPTTLEQLWKWAQRSPTSALLTGATLALLLAILAGASLAMGRISHERDTARRMEQQAAAGRDETRRSLYVSRTRLAASALMDGDLERCRQLLGAEPPPDAGWEWYHLRKRAIGDPAIIFDTEDVQWAGAAISPDGQQIVLAEAKFPGTATRGQLVTLGKDGPHSNSIPLPAHSAGGSRAVAWAPDSSSLAIVADETLHIVTPGQKETRSIHVGCPLQLTWAPDGSRIAVTTRKDGDMRLCIYAIGDTLTRIENWENPARHIVWLPDSSSLRGIASNGAITLFTPGKEPVTQPSPPPRTYYTEAWSQDASLVALVDETQILIFNAATGRTVIRLNGRGASFLALAFSADGRELTAGSSEPGLRRWDTSDWSERAMLRGHTGAVIWISPHYQQILSLASDGEARLWQGGPPSGLSVEPSKIQDSATFNGIKKTTTRDGTLSAVWQRGSLRILDEKTGTIRPVSMRRWAIIRTLIFTPDGKTLVAATDDMRLTFWNVATGEEVAELPSRVRVNQLEFIEEGKSLRASGTTNALVLTTE